MLNVSSNHASQNLSSFSASQGPFRSSIVQASSASFHSCSSMQSTRNSTTPRPLSRLLAYNASVTRCSYLALDVRYPTTVRPTYANRLPIRMNNRYGLMTNAVINLNVTIATPVTVVVINLIRSTGFIDSRFSGKTTSRSAIGISTSVLMWIVRSIDVAARSFPSGSKR